MPDRVRTLGVFGVDIVGEEIGPKVVKYVSVLLWVKGVGVLLAETEKVRARTRSILG